MVVWMEKIGGEIYCRHQDHKVKNFLYEKKTNACNRIVVIVVRSILWLAFILC